VTLNKQPAARSMIDEESSSGKHRYGMAVEGIFARVAAALHSSYRDGNGSPIVRLPQRTTFLAFWIGASTDYRLYWPQRSYQGLQGAR
jgi:hypothetical protein